MYELVETLQQKDQNDTVLKIIGRVQIKDNTHGIRAVNFILEGDELNTILALPVEEQKAAFIAWLEPKVDLDHQEWISSITKPLESIWTTEPTFQETPVTPEVPA